MKVRNCKDIPRKATGFISSVKQNMAIKNFRVKLQLLSGVNYLES